MTLTQRHSDSWNRNRDLFKELAAYNGDRHHGVVFDEIKQQRMQLAQDLFDLLSLADACVEYEHVRLLPGGGYVCWNGAGLGS